MFHLCYLYLRIVVSIVVCFWLCSSSMWYELKLLIHCSINRVALCAPTPKTTRSYPLCKTISAIVEVSQSYKANIRHKSVDIKFSALNALCSNMLLLDLIFRRMYIFEYIYILIYIAIMSGNCFFKCQLSNFTAMSWEEQVILDDMIFISALY